jgi:hypothetical protein
MPPKCCGLGVIDRELVEGDAVSRTIALFESVEAQAYNGYRAIHDGRRGHLASGGVVVQQFRVEHKRTANKMVGRMHEWLVEGEHDVELAAKRLILDLTSSGVKRETAYITVQRQLSKSEKSSALVAGAASSSSRPTACYSV